MSDRRAPLVAVAMGSDSDLKVMGDAIAALTELEVPHEVRVLSAHRTPWAMLEFGRDARTLGFKVIIAGAGGAAHLPGMLAAATSLPVIGVPVDITPLQGLDSLLSIVQMPKGVPVATVAVNGARNAGLLAARILSTNDAALADRLDALREREEERVRGVDEEVRRTGGRREGSGS
ncbi:MAG TPA: 5-(carboxyamino)imidazole ribonucleotide mutase [Acidimicrobiales bacterium]|nr:5-(carboxyamino)imidazole ribonucleotide mutase [Acidimicrobiales bacterium]